MPEPGYPGSSDSATMPPPPPGPSGYVPSDIPAQQGEFLGRILDPVRACALQAAVEWLPTRWAADGILAIDQILQAADQFAMWLVGDRVSEQPPGTWFASDPSVGPHRFSPVQGTRRYCLLFTGPDAVCGKEQDDPAHQEASR